MSHATVLNAATHKSLSGTWPTELVQRCYDGQLKDPVSDAAVAAAAAFPLTPLISLKLNHLPHLHVEGLGLDHSVSCMKVKPTFHGPGYIHL